MSQFTSSLLCNLVPTVESPKGLSGKICLRVVPRQTFPRRAAPRESLIPQGTSRGQIFWTNPKDFPLFVSLWASKTLEDAAQSCPMGLYGDTGVSDLLKSDSLKSRLWWLKNKVCADFVRQNLDLTLSDCKTVCRP